VTSTIILAAVGGLLLGALIAFLWLRSRLEAARIAAGELRARLEAERSAAAEKLALLEDAQRKLGDTFRALSADALDRNARSFLDLARSTLEQSQERVRGDLESRTKAIDAVVEPLKASLERVDTRIQELERVRSEAYGALAEQVRSLARTQLGLQAETANLVRALRQPTVRGRWGEITLRRVVEMAGMVAYCDFVEQETAVTDDGRLRPDMVVRLPNGKRIVIDSKAPLQGYLDALESDDDAARMDHMRKHAQQIRSHIGKLAARSYWSQFQPTPEFVVLFLPGESFFSAALERDPSLIEAGVEQGVVVATPTTLIALLKAVSYGWQQDLIARSAREISALGRDLHARIAIMTRHLADLRRGLDRAVKSYNDAVGSFERRVLPAARRFKDLGAATGEIPMLEPLDRTTRDVESPELFDSPEELR